MRRYRSAGEEVMDAAGAWRQPQRPRGRYMRSSGVRREDFIANEERKSRSCAAFALAGGLALIIAGSVIMRRADYGHVKSHLVEEYNKSQGLFGMLQTTLFESPPSGGPSSKFYCHTFGY